MASSLSRFEAKLARDRIKTSDTVMGALREAVMSQDCRKAILSILSDPEHKHFVAMYQLAINRLLGMPRQAVELTGVNGTPIKFEPMEFFFPQAAEQAVTAVAIPLVAPVTNADQPDYSWAPEVTDDEEDAA